MVNDDSLAKTGDIVAQIATLDHPDELYTIPGGKLTRITHTNGALMGQLKLSYGEYVHFKSEDGTIISGFLYKPVDYVPGIRTVDPFGRITRSSITRRNSSPPTAMPCSSRIRAAQRGKVRTSPKPSGPTGATRIFRTTWPWSITPSSREVLQA